MDDLKKKSDKELSDRLQEIAAVLNQRGHEAHEIGAKSYADRLADARDKAQDAADTLTE